MDTITPRRISQEYRAKLLPHAVDHRAETTPDLLYAEYPVSLTSYDEGFRKFTYGELANAINGVAWWLQESLGPGNFDTLAYLGPNDIRIPALILGAVKAGYVIFLPSPRNSIAAQFHLLAETKCSTLISFNPAFPPVAAILNTPDHKLRSLQIPSVEKLIGEVHPNFPFEKEYKDASTESLCMVHTSGSTGMPKILVVTHGTAMGNIEMMGKEPPPGFHNLCKLWQENRAFAVFPPFHAMYLAAFLFNTVTFGTVMIAPVALAIPTAEGMVQALKHTKFDAAFILPSILRELSQNPELLTYCQEHLDMMFFAGGDLPQEVGNIVASKIKLANHYGSSESGLLSLLLPKDKSQRAQKDWKYLQFQEGLGLDFRQYNDDEYELYIKRDASNAKYQPVFEMLRDIEEFRTRDLFVRHPSKPDLWKWSARADDIIVFLTGEKTNPTSMEQSILSQNPEILGLLVAGAQRFQAALLIHPKHELPDLSAKAAFIEKIWPSIEEANQLCPAHARIAKSHILFTTPSKAMLFSGKGTIQRAATLKLYASELDKLYEDADKMIAGTNWNPVIDINRENVQQIANYIREAVSSTTGWANFEDSKDFFTLGMDSLQAMMLVRKFRQDLVLPSFSTSTIYANPSVAALSVALVDLKNTQKATEKSSKETREQERKDLIEKYQSLINQIPATAKTATPPEDKHVIFTGSTGSLGSYILQVLLDDPTVAHVYCLNRNATRDRQVQRNQKSGLPTELDTSRVTYLSADLSKPQLGLESSIFNQLQTGATYVIHNAWPVNFNLNIEAFHPHLTGLVNLINFVTTAKHNAHLMFVSSISSIIGTDSTGYAESKYISEVLLAYASNHFKEASFSAAPSLSVARVGQIAGAINYKGLWNPSEWFPSMVLSSIHLGIIPNSLGAALGKIDWVPIDVLANVLVELTFCETKNGEMTIFHPLNPHVTTYEALLPTIISTVSSLTGDKKQLIPVAPAEWIVKVRKDLEMTAGPNSDHELKEGELENFLRHNPAAKLLDFYSDMFAMQDGSKFEIGGFMESELGVKDTTERSKYLRELGPIAIKEEWLIKWLTEWVNSVSAGGEI